MAVDVHIMMSVGEKPYQCKYCDEAFKCYKRMIVHMGKHTGKKPYYCNKCGTSFALSSGLKKHMRCHTREGPYKCIPCDISFKIRGTLTLHTRKHTGEKPYKCDQCDESFKRNLYLKNHKTKCHNQNRSLRGRPRNHTIKQLYTCNHCDKSYKHYSSHKYHMMKNTEESLYLCNKCNNSFTSRCSLRLHMMKHTGERPYQCNQLHKICQQNSVHTSHSRVCNCEDFKSHTLQNHISSISVSPDKTVKSKVFACFICKERFNNLIKCRQHMKTHSKSKKPMLLIKDRITCQEIAHQDHSRAPTSENMLNSFGTQNGITDTPDLISIKLEQDINGDLEQELDDYAVYNDIDVLQKVINPSEKDLKKMENIDTREQISIKEEKDFIKDTMRQAELNYVDVKAEEDEMFDALCLVKQEII